MMTADEEIEAAIDDALVLIRSEVLRAIKKFPRFNNNHEGYAVILEELDELWDDVKSNNLNGAHAEAIQVGAMVVRFISRK